MVSLFRDPSGEKVFGSVEATTVDGRRMSVSNEESRIKQLEDTIIQLQRQLTDMGVVIVNRNAIN